MRILIADDNERVRRGITAVLSYDKDWQVCGEARDGTETLEKTRELFPDLVLLDVSMPGRMDWKRRGGCGASIHR
jgi:YesN/AraC family two-component response regulator